MFLSFEGIDCCGKTTQANLLKDHLTSLRHNVLFLREPGGTEISEQIRTILLHKKNLRMTQIAEILLFSASRSQLVSEVILPALDNGTIVITDRFADSTTAYQGWGRGLPADGVAMINTLATEGLVPHRTYLIDISVEEMHRRRLRDQREADRMESSSVEFYEKVRAGYHHLAATEQERFLLIDGTKAIDEIQAIIRADVAALLGQ